MKPRLRNCTGTMVWAKVGDMKVTKPSADDKIHLVERPLDALRELIRGCVFLLC
jgi:hypothetical protein